MGKLYSKLGYLGKVLPLLYLDCCQDSISSSTCKRI